MSAPVKFLFEDDFAAKEAAKPAEPMIPLSAHQAALADAEARGHRAGLAAAEARAVADAERRAAAAYERIAGSLEALGRGLACVEARLEAEAIEVAVAVARKLAPQLIAAEPLAEISALAADCFRHLIAAPHVAIRVNDTLYESARARLEEIARMHGFDGRLVVLASPEIAVGDCRIEWADGGMVRDRAALETTIAEAVGRYVAARRAASSPS